MIHIRNLSLAGLALFAASAYSQTVRVVVDGDPIVFADQQPSEANGHVLVPLRGVFEKLGATVEWNPSNQTITARKQSRRVTLAIGQLDASVDDQPVHMDVPATLVGGTTMVPLRFVSEALGAYVTWNAPQHEVDITRPVDYNLPGRRDDRKDRDRKAPPPSVAPPVAPPIVHRVEHRDEPRRPSFGIIPADTVIPLVLNTRLSSRNARPGDAFTATVITGGMHHYFDLPEGTQAFGSVVYVRRQNGRDSGVIELNFDHLALPNGHTLRIIGKLIGLDDQSVRHLPNGAIVAISTERHDRVVYSGNGSGVGLIIAFKGPDAQKENALTHFIEGAIQLRHAPETHDVELRPGTQIGIRLYQNLSVPR